MSNPEIASRIIWRARSSTPPERLPCVCAPTNLREALAIQREVVRLSGERPGAWTVAVVPDGIAHGAILPSCLFRAGETVTVCEPGPFGLEAEIAFELMDDLPADGPLDRAYVAGRVAARVAVEVVATRFQAYENAPFLDRVADLMSNAALVLGPAWEGWSADHPGAVAALLHLAGGRVVAARSGHPAGDPLAPLLALLASEFRPPELGRGSIVITGSLTGITWVQAPASGRAVFADIGEIALALARP